MVQTPVLNEDEHTFIDSFGTKLIQVHSKEDCFNPTCCVIHHPSDHHMKDWPLLWRDDRRIFERICPHGVGHPDPDDSHFQSTVLGDTTVSIHGCDGCCAPD